MKTFAVTLADFEGVPHGSTLAHTKVKVEARYSSDLTLTDGRIVPAAVKVKELPSTGERTFKVWASDDPAVAASSRGFAVIVTATITPTRGGKGARVQRTVKPLMSMDDVIHLGTLSPAEPVPPQWSTVDDMLADVEASRAAAQAAVAQVGPAAVAAAAPAAAAAAAAQAAADSATLAAAWDGPILTQGTVPSDDSALWIDGAGDARQFVGDGAPLPTSNLARQPSTHAVDGYTLTNANSLRMAGGRVTMTTNTGLVAAILRMDNPTFGVSVTPGRVVTLSADIGGGAAGHGSTYLLRIVWKDAAGASLSSVNGATAALTEAGERRITKGTAPANAATATWQIVGTGAATVAADVWVTRVTATTDGTATHIAGDAPGYGWAGSPGLSEAIPTDTGPWRVVSTVDSLRRKRKAAASTATVDPWLAHAVRRDTMRHRRGGTLGTSGKQVIAVRLDHGTQQARW